MQKNNLKHMLLIGDNGINNQFIQREIEKYSDFSLAENALRALSALITIRLSMSYLLATYYWKISKTSTSYYQK